MGSALPSGQRAADMYIDVRGRRAFATTGGKPFDSSKPVVLFLHGSGLDHTFWGLQTRYFAHHGYSVLALDLPGHGFGNQCRTAKGGAGLHKQRDLGVEFQKIINIEQSSGRDQCHGSFKI